MLCEKTGEIRSNNFLIVLILVLMEDALRELNIPETSGILVDVLILVLMEDALRVK